MTLPPHPLAIPTWQSPKSGLSAHSGFPRLNTHVGRHTRLAKIIPLCRRMPHKSRAFNLRWALNIQESVRAVNSLASVEDTSSQQKPMLSTSRNSTYYFLFVHKRQYHCLEFHILKTSHWHNASSDPSIHLELSPLFLASTSSFTSLKKIHTNPMPSLASLTSFFFLSQERKKRGKDFIKYPHFLSSQLFTPPLCLTKLLPFHQWPSHWNVQLCHFRNRVTACQQHSTSHMTFFLES